MRATSSSVRVSATSLSRVVVLVATVSIGTALMATHSNPRRFRIHPLPYVSDAGLYDPERVVLSFGLSFAAAVFVPLALALSAHQRISCAGAGWVAAAGRGAALVLAVALAAMAAVPGWYIPHHITAAIFAVAADVWCFTVARAAQLSAARTPVPALTTLKKRLPRWVAVVYVLAAILACVIVCFAITWISVIVGWPWKMVRNKDFRFVILAVLEYLGAAAFLAVVHIVGVRPLRNHDIVFGVMHTDKRREENGRLNTNV